MCPRGRRARRPRRRGTRSSRWLHQFVGYAATKRALAEELLDASTRTPTCFAPAAPRSPAPASAAGARPGGRRRPAGHRLHRRRAHGRRRSRCPDGRRRADRAHPRRRARRPALPAVGPSAPRRRRRVRASTPKERTPFMPVGIRIKLAGVTQEQFDAVHDHINPDARGAERACVSLVRPDRRRLGDHRLLGVARRTSTTSRFGFRRGSKRSARRCRGRRTSRSSRSRDHPALSGGRVSGASPRRARRGRL